MNIQTILIPTDFSKLSDRAVEMGIALARAFSARIVLLHVMDRPKDQDALTAEYDDYFAYTRDQKSGLLEELCEKIKHEGIEATSDLVTGVPYEEIVRAAYEEKADLIVMGTHGRQGLDRLLTGSQAEQVVRAAPCPVVTSKESLKEAGEALLAV